MPRGGNTLSDQRTVLSDPGRGPRTDDSTAGPLARYRRDTLRESRTACFPSCDASLAPVELGCVEVATSLEVTDNVSDVEDASGSRNRRALLGRQAGWPTGWRGVVLNYT